MDSFKHIKAVGFELEGAWKKEEVFNEDESAFRPGFRSDGSVSGLARNNTWEGEYATPRALNEPLNVTNEMAAHWPTEWNSTCGFHIHISTKNLEAYSRLMDKGFYLVFKREVEKSLIPQMQNDRTKEQFTRRLAGESTYCLTGWKADDQVMRHDKASCRYHHLNFCWSLHGTMEVRIPPMMSYADGKTTVEYITQLVEEYLQKRKKIVTFKADVETEGLQIEKVEAKYETIIKKDI